MVGLTAREKAILALCSQGYHYGEVARELGISRNTVCCIASRAMIRMGWDNIVHAVAQAIRLGIIE